MRWFTALAWVAIGCNGPSKSECLPSEMIDGFVDEDGDGFGTGPAERVCALGEDYVDNGVDCNDADPLIHPDAEEVCNGIDDDCSGEIDQGFNSRLYYPDEDGDGFGAPFPAQRSCVSPGDGWVRNSRDCDDENPDIHPNATEVCNDGIDDDCDLLTDDSDPDLDTTTQITVFRDLDADGFGDPNASTRACVPSAGFVGNSGDCHDTRQGVNPNATEICNGIDDDCDQMVDDADPSLDTDSQLEFYADSDGDGFGDPDIILLACSAIAGLSSDNDDDCDDTTALASPANAEILCDEIDNDCQPLTTDDVDRDFDGYTHCVDDCDDDDPTRNPAAEEIPDDNIDQNCNALEGCYADADGDFARTDTWTEVDDPLCTGPGNAPGNWPLDCDDTDPVVNVDVEWVFDGDGDGYGVGEPVVTQCLHPGGSLTPITAILDCDDTEPTINPGAIDPCNDGFDTNCDGRDDCRSCLDWQNSSVDPADGIYTIDPDGAPADVWCDMTTDGGGWTLVASTTGQTLNDAAGNWYNDLTTLDPLSGHDTIWDGLRDVVDGDHDVRFACKVAAGSVDMDVDLSFYDVPWYEIMTIGSDNQSCFNDNNGIGQTPEVPPARRDNISGAVLAVGDQWNAGYLEGEDACSSTDDFTVDFDDRGMDSNQFDGTDWGEDDSSMKCGSVSVGSGSGSWFIFVRE